MSLSRFQTPSAMGNYAFENTYNLSSDQLERLDEAEDLMLKGALGTVSYTHLTLPTKRIV